MAVAVTSEVAEAHFLDGAKHFSGARFSGARMGRSGFSAAHISGPVISAAYRTATSLTLTPRMCTDYARALWAAGPRGTTAPGTTGIGITLGTTGATTGGAAGTVVLAAAGGSVDPSSGPSSPAIFWPFTFWPWGFYDPFWAYGNLFVWDAMFWPGPQYTYGPYGDVYGRYTSGGPARTRVAARRVTPETTGSVTDSADLAQSCGGLAPGVTDLPIDKIQQSLQLNDDQLKSLNALKAASSQASYALKASCSSEMSMTPLGRLDTVQKRLDGMVQAWGVYAHTAR